MRAETRLGTHPHTMHAYTVRVCARAKGRTRQRGREHASKKQGQWHEAPIMCVCTKSKRFFSFISPGPAVSFASVSHSLTRAAAPNETETNSEACPPISSHTSISFEV